MAPDNRIAVCPGSYDPVTNGHLDVISRASAMFDKVIVAVVNLPVRKGGPRSIPVVDSSLRTAAKAIVKGLRASSDCDYELELHQLNRRQVADAESAYLMASPQYSFVTSSCVKELATSGGTMSSMVP